VGCNEPAHKRETSSLQADALYRTVMGFNWCRRHEDGAVEAQEVDLTGPEASSQTLGALNPHRLLDIADFIGVVELDLEEFIMDLDAWVPQAS
jgi:hypothetical protein